MYIQFLNIYATIILFCSDAFFYGFCYEKKKWFKSWLFWECIFRGRIYVPFYRLLIQWPLDALALYLVWQQGYILFLGMLLAWFCQVKEGGYYVVLNQWKNLKDGDDMYWLNRFWFSQWWFYRDNFTVKSFKLSLLIGVIVLILSNIIHYLL